MPDELFTLHQRLIAGDRTASEELAPRLLEPLRQRTQRSYPHVNEHVVADGVIDAVLDYCAHPERAKIASGQDIQGLLATAAWRNVANAVRGEKRRRWREDEFVRRSAGADVEDESALGKLVGQEERADQARRIQQLMDLCTSDTDREVLRLRLAGERGTDAFARILGIEHLPPGEQRRGVKRAKDRIDKMIRRSELRRREGSGETKP